MADGQPFSQRKVMIVMIFFNGITQNVDILNRTFQDKYKKGALNLS